MTRTTNVRPAPRRTGRRPGSWAGYAGFAWSMAYLLIVHGPSAVLGRYWLLPTDPAGGIPVGRMRVVEAGVCLLLLGCAMTSLAQVRPWGRILPRWAVLGVAWVGSVIGVLHWIIWTGQSVLRMVGAVHVAAPAGVAQSAQDHYVRVYDTMNVFVLEPWFLGMGVFLGIAAAQNIRRSRTAARRGTGRSSADLPPPAWLTRRGWTGYLATGWALVTSALHLYWATGGTLGLSLGLPVPGDHIAVVRSFSEYLLVVAVLTGCLAPLCLVLVGLPRRLAIALTVGRVAAGVLVLGGLVVVLVGIMSFDPWIFGGYGPWMMAGGILTELAAWHHRLVTGRAAEHEPGRQDAPLDHEER